MEGWELQILYYTIMLQYLVVCYSGGICPYNTIYLGAGTTELKMPLIELALNINLCKFPKVNNMVASALFKICSNFQCWVDKRVTKFYQIGAGQIGAGHGTFAFWSDRGISEST